MEVNRSKSFPLLSTAFEEQNMVFRLKTWKHGLLDPLRNWNTQMKAKL